MIRNSFSFLENVGEKKEKGIWKQGIKNWDDFLRNKKIKGISQRIKPYYDRKIREARANLYNLNSEYFYDKLPTDEHWRLYNFFKEEAVFLDIETTGLSEESDILVIGLFDGINTKTMIRNINLDFKKLKEELKKYKLIVSFNGSVFDLPFISKYYPNILPRIPHFDLRFASKRIGLSGGLKGIEKQLGIKRSKVVDGIYGGDVLRLWKRYRATGDDYYLKLLVEYNEEDIINLRTIADYAYERLRIETLS